MEFGGSGLRVLRFKGLGPAEGSRIFFAHVSGLMFEV